VRTLESAGHIVHKRNMADMVEATEEWRDNAEEKMEATADNAIRNLELPSIKCIDTEEWLDYEDIAND